ncbi:MAG: hypothetical protein V1685_03070 [Parcubacteria group bacterium]
MTNNDSSQPATKGDLDALGEWLESRILKHVDGSISELARITKDGFDAVDKRLDELDRGQDDIKLRLHEFAHNFEVVDLTRRVQRIEQKVGISGT